MKKVAYLFPGEGHGSVSAGMGREIWQFPAAQKVFQEADRVLSFPFSNLCFSGPQEELFRFRNAVLAPVVVGMAYAAVIDELDGRYPDLVAGFSAGYVTAIIYAGVVSFEEGLKIILKATELIEEISTLTPGKMMILINPNLEEIEWLLGTTLQVEVGLYNCESQVVLSGERSAVDRLTKLIKDEGLTEAAVPLDMGVAAHSAQLESMEEPFATFLSGIPFRDPWVPIIGNCDAWTITTAQEAKREAERLSHSPVLWDTSIAEMQKEGVTTFVEVGYGEVLSNLLKRSEIGEIKISTSFHLAKEREKRVRV